MNLSNTRKVSFILLFIYFIVRFLSQQQLETIDFYASYYFEAFFVFLGFLIFKPPLMSFYKVKANGFITALLFLILGYFAFKGASVQNLNVPFDFMSLITLVFLLLVAPILEELLFRFVLWDSIKEALQINGLKLLILTSAIFSYSHFHAYFLVPEEYIGFIFYQTLYTFVLALGCGYFRLKQNSIITSILIHGMFNLGFLLGFMY